MTTYNTIIIGSGISGIFALKHLIEEGNTNVLVLDKNPEAFGVWNIKNKPSVYENTYAVSSKLYMTISDFPFPDETPEFPHHSIILNYYNNYAKHFNLYPYIRQNCTIRSIKKEKNKWFIQTNDIQYYATYVIVATGTVNDCPNIPNDSFYKNFTGQIYHNDSYDKIKNVEGKKILIVGGSDTASDLAMELKRKNKVTVSIKNGVWFQNRNFGAYEAADSLYNRFTDFIIKNIASKKYADDYIAKHNANGEFNMNSTAQFWWGEGGSGIDIWKPKCDYLNSYYVKSRDLISEISKGNIIPQNGIKSIDKNAVTFETNNTSEFDIILFCTGYKPLKCMQFLDDSIVNVQKYKHIFYINDPSIMFIGFIRPYLTSIPMLSELQSRWISKFICGKVKLPDSKTMEMETISDDKKQSIEFPCAYERLKTIVDPYDYCNLIADKIGANVNMFYLLFTNPSLFYMILLDSWNHHVFRLNDTDPEKRKNAEESILKNHNDKTSTKIRQLSIHNYFYRTLYLIIIFIGIIFAYIHRNKILYFFRNNFNISRLYTFKSPILFGKNKNMY